MSYWTLIAATRYTAVEADGNITKLPAGVDEKTAAAAMLQGMTAFAISSETYQVKKGDIVLILAAAGGVGLLLVQIVKMLGATIIAVASTDEKIKLVQEFGADYICGYDFKDRVMEITGGQGVNVVFDSVGKATFEDSLVCIARKGTVVMYGNASGVVPPFDIGYASSPILYLQR